MIDGAGRRAGLRPSRGLTYRDHFDLPHDLRMTSMSTTNGSVQSRLGRPRGASSKTTIMAAEAVGFNYDQTGIPKPIADQLKARAVELRALKTSAVNSMLEMGRMLSEVRKTLRPSVFRAWVLAEVQLAGTTADNFVRCYETFKSLPGEAAQHFQPSALLELTRRKISQSTRDQAVALASSGTLVTRSQVVAIIDANRGPDEESEGNRLELHRLRSALRSIARNWEGSRRDLAGAALEVLREELAICDGGRELDVETVSALEATARALGVVMVG